MYWKLSRLTMTTVFLLAIFFSSYTPAFASRYYSEQTNFTETSVPLGQYHWNQDKIDVCIYKENSVSNSYYVWTKLAVQSWRQALREYTNNQEAWDITARYVKSQAALESCDVKVYIYDTYKDYRDYANQTGAYTSLQPSGISGKLDARVYLSPIVLHGDGKTEINLPSYAFRNSAVHEIGHVLGLNHMLSVKGYLMSPQFDFWEEKDQLPITTLELGALINVYGTNGF
jgi:hypothetical protein